MMERSPATHRSRAVKWFALYALLGGLISLFAWPLDIPRLSDWDNNGISVQPNTAVAAVAAAAALLLLRNGKRRTVATLGTLITLIGASSLFQFVSEIDLPWLNSLLTFDREWGRVGVVSPGRMGP